MSFIEHIINDAVKSDNVQSSIILLVAAIELRQLSAAAVERIVIRAAKLNDAHSDALLIALLRSNEQGIDHVINTPPLRSSIL